MPDEFDIPQIKPEKQEESEVTKEPKSILDPPQIKPKTTEDTVVDRPQKANPDTMNKTEEKPKRRISFRKLKLNKKRIGIAGSVIAVVIVIFVVLVMLPALAVYRKGQKLADQAKVLQASVDTQDISKVKEELGKFKTELQGFQGTYKTLGWMRVVPWAGAYYRDGDAGVKAGLYGIDAAELLIETAEPYADIIGFAGPDSQQSTSGEDTANDRIDFIVQTIEGVLPQMDAITEKAMLAKAEIDKIDPNRYPEKLKGKEVRSKLEKAISLADEGTTMLAESKPLMEAAPYLLGIDSQRTYLLLFQNDKELRPTGGFITAYSIMNVDKGKVEPVSSSDIYNLDSQYRPQVPAPDELRNYLKGPYTLNKNFFLRDMNWSPDFKESMNLFITEAEKAGVEDIDGIIAVDTQVLVNILDAIGQIGVPGFGNFSTENDPRCDCPNVIYELESFADVEGPIVWSENEPGKIVFAPPNYDNRKKIVGPLMNSVLSNAMGQPKEKLPDLFEAAWKSVTEKHILLFMFDEKAQKGAEGFNIAGRIREFEGDYLHISDANLGGRKSNLYVTQEVNQEVSVSRDGTVEKTLTITYKNPQDHDGWLNSVLPNWTRIYVPKGSELLETEGFDDRGETYEELGKTVFSGGFELRPQGVKKIVVKYKLPNNFDDTYKILVQKQPGLDAPLYTFSVGKQREELFLRGDKEFRFKI